MKNASQPISQAEQTEPSDTPVATAITPTIASQTAPRPSRVILMRDGEAMRFPSLGACWKNLLDEGNAAPSLL